MNCRTRVPVNCIIHPAGLPMNISILGVLRRPVESAQPAPAPLRRPRHQRPQLPAAQPDELHPRRRHGIMTTAGHRHIGLYQDRHVRSYADIRTRDGVRGSVMSQLLCRRRRRTLGGIHLSGVDQVRMLATVECLVARRASAGDPVLWAGRVSSSWVWGWRPGRDSAPERGRRRVRVRGKGPSPCCEIAVD